MHKTTNHRQRFSALAVVLFATTILPTFAAVAPLGTKQLEKQSSHVVSGTVVNITSMTQKSKVAKVKGIHRDRVYRIKIKVEAVSKGANVKVGSEIEVEVWRPSTRIPPLPGSQGHESIPKKGDKSTFYLRVKDEGIFTPLLPNGIELNKEKP